MSSCLVASMKLSGLRDRMFSALYPGMVLIVLGIFCPFANVSILAWRCLSRFLDPACRYVPCLGVLVTIRFT